MSREFMFYVVTLWILEYNYPGRGLDKAVGALGEVLETCFEEDVCEYKRNTLKLMSNTKVLIMTFIDHSHISSVHDFVLLLLVQ